MNNYKIFQIWIEDPDEPQQKSLSLMRNLIDKKPKASTYTLIASRNYLDDIPDVNFINVNNVINEMLEIPRVKEVFDKICVQHKSDLIRAYWASKNKNSLYADCDIEISQFPMYMPQSEKPYFLAINNRRVDANFFLTMNATEFFDFFFKKNLKRMNNCIKSGGKPRYSHTFSMLNRYPDSFIRLEYKHIKHYSISRKKAK